MIEILTQEDVEQLEAIRNALPRAPLAVMTAEPIQLLSVIAREHLEPHPEGYIFAPDDYPNTKENDESNRQEEARACIAELIRRVLRGELRVD